MRSIAVRMGVDIGGTFTDVVLEKSGELFSAKVLTTYAAPENAIIDGMHQVCTKAAFSPADIGQIIHGTTLATNALIARSGARGGGNGAPTTIAQDDRTPIRVKGKQFVPHGRRVMMVFPGGAGYGDPKDRDRSLVKRDLARGYITADTAARDYGLSDQEIAAVEKAVRKGEPL